MDSSHPKMAHVGQKLALDICDMVKIQGLRMRLKPTYKNQPFWIFTVFNFFSTYCNLPNVLIPTKLPSVSYYLMT